MATMRTLAALIVSIALTACSPAVDSADDPGASQAPCEADAQCIVDECHPSLVEIYVYCQESGDWSERCADNLEALVGCADNMCGAGLDAVGEAACQAGGACETVCE